MGHHSSITTIDMPCHNFHIQHCQQQFSQVFLSNFVDGEDCEVRDYPKKCSRRKSSTMAIYVEDLSLLMSMLIDGN